MTYPPLVSHLALKLKTQGTIERIMSPTVEVQVTWLNQVSWQPFSFPQILYLKLELLMLKEEKELWMKFDPSLSACCCCSVAKSCLTLCDLMDCSMSGSSVLHYLQDFSQIHVHWISDATFPSTKVFSNESALYIRWPKYWSFKLWEEESINSRYWKSIWK